MEDDRTGEDLIMCEEDEDEDDRDEAGGDEADGDGDEDDEDDDEAEDDDGNGEDDYDDEDGEDDEEDGEDSEMSQNEDENILRKIDDLVMNDAEAFQDMLKEHKRNDKVEKDARKVRGRQARRLLAELLCVFRT